MNDHLFEEIYDTLLGLRSRNPVPGIENAFEEGSFCLNSYGEMLAAYERLCERLGTVDEDDDVEVVINALLDIQRVLCRKMFKYGFYFGFMLNTTGK